MNHEQADSNSSPRVGSTSLANNSSKSAQALILNKALSPAKVVPTDISFQVGVTYQLGNLASSASATIQSVIGERYPLPPKNGVKRFDYGKVIGIFMGAVWAYQLLFLFLGPEMSEEERAEYAYHANELERQRKAGQSEGHWGRAG